MIPVENFWKTRAKNFEKLEWAKRENFLNSFLEFCQPQKDFLVLELGSGTGIVTRALSPRVNTVVGIDISQDMIKKALFSSPNIKYQLMNAEKLSFNNDYFDLVIGRMVFHHIDHLEKAMRQAYRVLKKDKNLVICEGIPPDDSVRKSFIEIFKLKEKRHTFSSRQLRDLYKVAGFKNINMKTYIMRKVSMKNWLNNSGLSDKICQKIVQLHLKADDNFKRLYRMQVTSKDIYLNWKFIFISGTK